MDSDTELSYDSTYGTDDTIDIGAEDDIIVDHELDEVFHQPLIDNVSSESQNESEDSLAVDDDDEQDGSEEIDSNPDLTQPPTQATITIAAPVNSVGRGRGRAYQKAVDVHGQPLPPPRIDQAEVDTDSYPKPARIATLPISYSRKREDPEIQKQRRALRSSTPLINFKVTLKQISIIIDQDDGENKGYQHACRLLKTVQPDLDVNQLQPSHSVWSFGLHIYSIRLKERIKCNLLELFPENFDAEENRPFWFTFEDLPRFEDTILREKQPPAAESHKGIIISLDDSIYADLFYGGLTTMNCFHIHDDYRIRKRSRWSIRFHDEFFEIQSLVVNRIPGNVHQIRSLKKYKITMDIIDRAAIFHLRNDGFDLFVNMKGNVHELERDFKPSNPNELTFDSFKRQGIKNDKPMPLFSTIRIRIRLRDEQKTMEYLERTGEITTNTSNEEKNKILQTSQNGSLTIIRKTLRLFLELFNRNRIHISFGSIISKCVSLNHLMSLDCERFKTFIQSYSWAMLCNIGFRMQVKLYQAKGSIDELHNYSNQQEDENDSSEVDDRFYRLCLYLHRRSSEYFFLDVLREIEIYINGLDQKYKTLKKDTGTMSYLSQLSSSTAYIPSVVLTPTTIKIRPLKLCKLNRVLREKRFGNYLNFALVELRDEAQRLLFPTVFRALKEQILNYLTNGFYITPDRRYVYLHHSQSQVKCKQFWFYYHDKDKGYLSHDDAYVWMGNFDKERVVAKHAARIALCFTSSDATIQIPAEKVTYIRDIKDPTGNYTFTDGVGTISKKLRDEIMEFLKRKYAFSVLQIRYGGCKGTISVDPRLDDQKYQLVIRDSMNKFTSDHDTLELCKLSAPRALYLNRQDIVLLESRDIPHTKFLQLQNDDQLWLIRALLMPSIAYELLQEKLLRVFYLRQIARRINIVEEPFFVKLIITCAFNIMRELIDRTRIRISHEKARNMFGIVDEYGVLEEGQVFVQFTPMRDNKLELPNKQETIEDDEDFEGGGREDLCEVLTQKIVITKNPCHHPGDLRVFDAVYHPELMHLKDVVVFPQKGSRPHPNEISGSDLDGDEYVVIWHDDLIPKTPNEKAYDYDSQEEPRKMDRPITRYDINQVVMEVSEQDCLGSLSNIHLAYADKEGIKSETCMNLAGAISQEVDAAKTGKHPLSDEEIAALRKGLGNEWPDFMRARGKKSFYPSERILGKLYRSALRAVTGWKRAVSYHGNSRHMDLANSLAITETDTNDQNSNETSIESNKIKYETHPLDPLIYHKNCEEYAKEIKKLYSTYQSELLEIINLYHFQDEIDLLCRCESMDASAGSNKKGGLEDSASIEVQNLVNKIRDAFFYEFNVRRKTKNCCRTSFIVKRNYTRKKIIYCEECLDDILAKAACAYIHSYTQSNRLPLKSNRRILSFAWIFSTYLIKLIYRNRKDDYIDQSNTIVGRACDVYLRNLQPKVKVFIPQNSVDFESIEFYYKIYEAQQTDSLLIKRKSTDKNDKVSLLRLCFIEILNDWLTEQHIFGDTCIETDPKPLIPESIWHELIIHFLTGRYQEKARIQFINETQDYITQRYSETIDTYRLQWTNVEKQKLQEMFIEMHSLAGERIDTTKDILWSYLDEYIMLALQCIAIEKRLLKEWTLQKLTKTDSKKSETE